jgi:ankyrin repeat protein
VPLLLLQDGNTPLHLAADEDPEVVKLLLAAGATVDAINKVR